MRWTNHFLETLEAPDRRNLEAHLEEVTLHRDDVLVQVGQDVGHVYLPVDAILSVVTVMKNGAQVESRTIGRESGFGLLHALGSRLSFERMLVQVAGRAWRLPVGALEKAAADSRPMTRHIVRHAQATLIQSALATACNTLHGAEERLCRWLLLTRDRLDSDIVPLTQEHLAIMLGVQRTTVTALASRLQERGHIAYSRGKIRILDRPAVESCACECYFAMQGGVQQLLDSAAG